MSYSDNALSFQSAISAPHPASSPGLVRRDFFINYTSGAMVYNYTGPASGLGSVISAGGVMLSASTTSATLGFLTVNNSQNGNFLAQNTTSGMIFVNNYTSGACAYAAWVISTS
jgi:hypothetical protein